MVLSKENDEYTLHSLEHRQKKQLMQKEFDLSCKEEWKKKPILYVLCFMEYISFCPPPPTYTLLYAVFSLFGMESSAILWKACCKKFITVSC